MRSAAIRGHVDVVKLLLDVGKDSTNHSNSYSKSLLDAPLQREQTALYKTAAHDQTEVLELLLKAGAEIEPQSDE